MSRTYSALLRGDRLEWTAEAPDSANPARPLAVTVTVEELPQEPDAERWREAVAALRRIAERGTLAAQIPDPAAWEREIRQDRPLPGREP